jgi:hypothetical protein
MDEKENRDSLSTAGDTLKAEFGAKNLTSPP